MPRRATSLNDNSGIAVAREIDSKYDVVKAVAGKLPEIGMLAALNIPSVVANMADIQTVQVPLAVASAATATTSALTATTKAAESSTSAVSASISAATATTKATEASTSASTATTKATEASTSASTATTKAAEALASATTATTKAAEASASALSATTKATEATASASTATTKAAEALASANNAHTSELAAGASEVNAEIAMIAAQDMIDDTTNSLVKTYSSTKIQGLHDIQAEAIANLATAQCHITQSSTPVLALTTTHNILPFTTHVDSTDTNIMIVNDAANTITFKKNASFNFLSQVLFSSATGQARTVTFALINNVDNSVLISETNVIDIPSGTTEGIALNTLITVGKNGIPAAPLTIRIEVYSTGTGQSIQSFNSILASSSAYNVSTEASGISVLPIGSIASTTVQTALAELDTEKVAVSTLGVVNGVATLDANGLVPSAQLPSYVDDILEYATKAILPAVGETGKIYIVIADESIGGGTSSYRWSGSVYAMVNNTQTATGGGLSKPFMGVPLFTKVSVSSISIPINTNVSVGATINTVLGTAYTLSLNSVAVGALDTGVKVAGTDYYVYALEAGGFILSANATNPTGYTTANSRKIGGFHYGVIPEAFAVINNINASDVTKIAGINAYTFWDLKYMPSNGDARGMFKAGSGKWFDIYLLNTDHHLYGTSSAGKTIAGGEVLNGRNFPKIPLFYGGNGTTTYGTLAWFEAAEIGKAYGKDLISYEEFVAIAYGVLEASSAGAADTGVTQHLANYTSKFGICMATGCQWIWGKDLYMRPDGTVWTYHTETEGRGSFYAFQYGPTAALFGGGRDDTSVSGSRASSWAYTVWSSAWVVGSRYACDHLELA